MSETPCGTSAWFGAETKSDPCAPYPVLRWRNRPYNVALTEAVLVPFLDAWERCRPNGHPPAAATTRALTEAAEAFRSVAKEAARTGDGAMLAALAVTANLQRTVERLARSASDPGPLSRRWCGLPPEPVRRRKPRSTEEKGPDIRPLARALNCSSARIEGECAEALALLREEIRRGGLLAPEDLPGYLR